MYNTPNCIYNQLISTIQWGWVLDVWYFGHEPVSAIQIYLLFGSKEQIRLNSYVVNSQFGYDVYQS